MPFLTTLRTTTRELSGTTSPPFLGENIDTYSMAEGVRKTRDVAKSPRTWKLRQWFTALSRKKSRHMLEVMARDAIFWFEESGLGWDVEAPGGLIAKKDARRANEAQQGLLEQQE